jgi:UDP-N-acetylmuramyl pentapeptide synthase
VGAEQVAAAAGARLAAPARAGDDGGGPARAVIDSRAAGPGDLFAGLPGANVDGARFAGQALAQGAWGVLVGPGHDNAGAPARCSSPTTRSPRCSAWPPRGAARSAPRSSA